MTQGAFGAARPQPTPPEPTLDMQGTTDPQSVRSNTLSSMDRLTAMVAARAKAPPKGKFIPGQPGKPTKGPRAYDVHNDPKHKASLDDVIATHQALHPGKKLKAPSMMAIWNAKNPHAPLNGPRMRSVLARVQKATDADNADKVAGYFRNGAKKTLKG